MAKWHTFGSASSSPAYEWAANEFVLNARLSKQTQSPHKGYTIWNYANNANVFLSVMCFISRLNISISLWVFHYISSSINGVGLHAKKVP